MVTISGSSLATCHYFRMNPPAACHSPVVSGCGSKYRVFLLSPAHCGGKRAGFLFRKGARFDLACRLQSGAPVPLGEIYAFVSGLYFRGKLAYSRAFAAPPPGTPGALVITPNRGLLDVDTPTTLTQLRAFSRVDINAADSRYTRPLRRDARALAAAACPDCEIVLLGSIASSKYIEILLEVFGEHLLFPPDFVGRGDLSRGGLMLRAVQDAQQLAYIPVDGATRRGHRPPRLERRPGIMNMLTDKLPD
jgi:hypothetical protein